MIAAARLLVCYRNSVMGDDNDYEHARGSADDSMLDTFDMT